MQDKRHNTVGVIIALAIISACIVGIIYASKHREETPKTEAPKYSAVQLLREQHKDELTEWDVLLWGLLRCDLPLLPALAYACAASLLSQSFCAAMIFISEAINKIFDKITPDR